MDNLLGVVAAIIALKRVWDSESLYTQLQPRLRELAEEEGEIWVDAPEDKDPGPIHLVPPEVVQETIGHMNIATALAFGRTSKERHKMLLSSAMWRFFVATHFRSPLNGQPLLLLAQNFQKRWDDLQIISRRSDAYALHYWQVAYAACAASVRARNVSAQAIVRNDGYTTDVSLDLLLPTGREEIPGLILQRADFPVRTIYWELLDKQQTGPVVERMAMFHNAVATTKPFDRVHGGYYFATWVIERVEGITETHDLIIQEGKMRLSMALFILDGSLEPSLALGAERRPLKAKRAGKTRLIFTDAKQGGREVLAGYLTLGWDAPGYRVVLSLFIDAIDLDAWFIATGGDRNALAYSLAPIASWQQNMRPATSALLRRWTSTAFNPDTLMALLVAFNFPDYGAYVAAQGGNARGPLPIDMLFEAGADALHFRQGDQFVDFRAEPPT